MRFDGVFRPIYCLAWGGIKECVRFEVTPSFSVRHLSLAFSVTSGVVSQVSLPGSLLYSFSPLVIYGLTHPSPVNRWRG